MATAAAPHQIVRVHAQIVGHVGHALAMAENGSPPIIALPLTEREHV